MKRVIPLIALGTLVLLNRPVFSAPVGAYYQVLQAVNARDEAGLKYLISVGVNINATNMQGKTALCTAVENQDYEGYELLLSEGATTRTPCMRNMNPEILARFQAEQPPLGTYYKGAVLTASRNGTFTTGKEVATTIGTLPYPHIGEILLGGVAVGTAFAVGVHGSGGGGDDPVVPVGKYASPFQSDDASKSNYLIADYFSNPTSATQLAATNPSDTSKNYTDYKNEYKATNTTGLSGENSAGDEVFSQNFLAQIKAADAYARGYTGYAVTRKADGSPTTTGWDAIDTNAPVKVAVMDNGLFWNEDLRDGKDLTGALFKKTTYGSGSSAVDYYQSVGKNFVYGTHPSETNPYWKETASTSTTLEASLMSNSSSSATVLATRKFTTDTSAGGLTAQQQWNQYVGQFAPSCDSISSGSTACLMKTDEETIAGTQVKRYTISYLPNKTSATDDAMATYYMYSYLWDQYVAKYGETGYKYDSADATGTFFQTKDASGSLSDIDHGTHVAGLISALRNGSGMQGVAYNAEIVPIKLDLEMGISVHKISDAVATDARIVNLSIAYETEGMTPEQKVHYLTNNTNTEEGRQYNAETWEYLSPLYSAAGENKTALIFAAGNSGEAQSSSYSVAPLVDENYKNLLINVVALGNSGKIAEYSNRCGATAGYCLSAPGGDGASGYAIFSTGTSILGESSYSMKQGTSMAAPVVSGSLAVLMGAFPFLTTQQAVQILLDTASYIEPTDNEIKAYNKLATGDETDYSAYNANLSDNYNAIYGRGIVNLAAATDPIGLPKITFGTTASSSNFAAASLSSAHVSPMMAQAVAGLPENLIVLDDYSRAYKMKTKSFVHQEKRSDALRRSFRSFMAADEKETGTTDMLSFAFSKAPADKKNVHTGSMSMIMRPNKNIQMRLGFTEDTVSFGGSYVGRTLRNPFMNMRQAFGAETAVGLSENWAFIGSWYTGKNGFIDEDVFDKMSKQSRMQFIEGGVAYQGIKNVTLSVSGGVMKEEDSLFGVRGAGAFDVEGAGTRFVRVMANFQPMDKLRFSGAYTYGMTEANKANSLMQFSRLTSDSFALAAEYTPDEKQTFGLKLVSPLRVRSGVARFDLPVARDAYEDRVYRSVYATSLKPTAREYDLSVFYANEISPELSWAGETGIRLNPDHQKDADPDYRALFKLNWMW